MQFWYPEKIQILRWNSLQKDSLLLKESMAVILCQILSVRAPSIWYFLSEDFETDEVRKEMSMSTEVKFAPVQLGFSTRSGIVTLIDVSDGAAFFKSFFIIFLKNYKNIN